MTYAAFESRYKERSYIGSGGFAKVYKVFDHAKDHYVALKVSDVRPEWKQFTLQREVELVNSLAPHRNIARYDACYRFNYGITGDTDFAVLRFYEAGNLEQFLSRETVTDHDKRLIIRGILQGVDFLHQRGIIHRDLKAQNILLSREDGVWTPKITDFGLARELGGSHTMTNSSIGLTFAYAAPEQIKHERVQPNVDLWAAGVLIYRIIMDELPFRGRKKSSNHRSTQSQLEISRKILNLELPPELDGMPEPYQSMCKRCFVLEPKERAQSAGDLLAILDAHSEVVAERTNPTVQPGPPNGDATELYLPGQESDETQLVLKQASVPPPPPPKQEQPAVAAKAPFAYDTEYVAPRPNATRVLNDAPRPTAPPVEAIETGGERGAWIPYAVAALLIGLMIGVFALLNPTENNRALTQVPASDNGAGTEVVQIGLPGETYRTLERDVQANVNNNAALAAIMPRIDAAIAADPDNYRLHLLASRTLLYQKDEAAFDYLQTAAELALEQGRGDELLQELIEFQTGNRRLEPLTDSPSFRSVVRSLRS